MVAFGVERDMESQGHTDISKILLIFCFLIWVVGTQVFYF